MLPRHNQRWTRHIQDAILTVLLCAWLGGVTGESQEGKLGRLLTLEEVGGVFQGLLGRPTQPRTPDSALLILAQSR